MRTLDSTCFIISILLLQFNISINAQKILRLNAPGDYMEVPHSEDLIPNNITIECWFCAAGLPFSENLLEEMIMDKREWDQNETEYGYNVRLFGESFPMGITADIAPWLVDKVEIIESQKWYFVSVTHDGSNLKLYLNGDLLSQAEAQFNPNSQQPLRIGEYLAYPFISAGFKGDLDEIRIWNYARTQEEIRAGMGEVLNGNENGLAAYWNFDNDTGNIIADMSPNGNDGMLYGNAQLIEGISPQEASELTPPFGLRAYGSENGIELVWEIPDGLDITSVAIYRGTNADFLVNDNSLIGSSLLPEQSYTDNDIGQGIVYYYRLRSVKQEMMGNISKTICSRTTDILDDYLTGAYYYPWYGNDLHWWSNGYSRRFFIPSQRPRMGEYWSKDPSLIRKHLDWMELFGIDFFVSSWWGPASYAREDVVLRDFILPELEGRPVKFSVYYELNKGELGGMTEEGVVINSTNAEMLKNEFIYLAENYFNHPNYLHVNGRPVVFLYVSATLSGDFINAFNNIRTELENMGHNLFLVGDEMNWGSPRSEHMQILDAVSPYILYGMPQHNGYPLETDFYADLSLKTVEWETACEENDIVFVPDVFPGFNDRYIRPTENNYVFPRRSSADNTEGSNYEEQIKLMRPFVDDELKMIMITSFNEWHEDTQIEPTTVTTATTLDNSPSGTEYTQSYSYEGYGYRYLEITKDLLASVLPTDTEDDRILIPRNYSLKQNYPNPFNPTTNISFSIPEKSFVSLKVYDILGKEISVLVNEIKTAGNYIIKFNAGNLSSGVYFYQIISGDYASTKKLIILR